MKRFISINLNQFESKAIRRDQWRERSRWTLFGLITAVLLYLNITTWWIGVDYSRLIAQKMVEIEDVKEQISALRTEGKNLSKDDILSLADLEQNRILWAKNLQLIGEMTPDDMAITSMKYKKNKIIISGVAVVYYDRKDFDIIHDYINKLKRNRDLADNFSEIRFNQGLLREIRGQKFVEFEIEAKLAVATG